MIFVLAILSISSILSVRLEAVRDTFNSDFSKTGYFNSPGYPYKSDTEKSKEFHFKGIPGERVRIVFDNFNLYRKNVNNRCGESDSVLRYEKENQKVVNLCGNIVPLPIMSESNELKLEYRQANEFPEEKQGFNGSYAFVTNYGIDSGVQKGTACSFEYRSTDRKNGTFFSPNYNGYYPKNSHCIYTFINNDSYLQLTFTDFNLLGSDICQQKYSGDSVEFSSTIDGDNNDYEQKCGYQAEFSKIVNATPFFVIFKSNDDRENDAQSTNYTSVGFNATFQFMNELPGIAPKITSSAFAAVSTLLCAVMETIFF